MYNPELLRNNYQLEVSVKQGEIWFIKDAPKCIIDKSRPVLIISDQESYPGGLVFCLQITTKYHHANSIPFLYNGSVSFINIVTEYVMSLKDLHTYGTRIGVIPNRVLEIARYKKVRIYGMPISEEHEKVYFDYSINILRKLLSNTLKLSRMHDDEINPKEFLGGKFSKIFENWEPSRNAENVYYPQIKQSKISQEEDKNTSSSNGYEEAMNTSTELVYTDTNPENSFNTVGDAIMKAFNSNTQKKVNARTPKKSKSANNHQKKDHSATIVKTIEESFDDSKKENDNKNLKPYFEINKKGDIVIKKVKDMAHGEMGLLLTDVKNTSSYTNFSLKCSMTAQTVKTRCIECIKRLDELGTPISDETRHYFTTDQRVKNNYQSHTIESNMFRKKCGQIISSIAGRDNVTSVTY